MTAEVGGKRLRSTVAEGLETVDTIQVESSDLSEALDSFTVLTNHVVEKLKLIATTSNKCKSAELEMNLMDNILNGALFVGHINTDLDSVSGAIAGANLFGGIATISEDKLNGEILFALEECGFERPPTFDEVPGGTKPLPDGTLLKVCLVDHNEENQMVACLRNDPEERKRRIVGLIDHHAVSSSFSSNGPLFMDIRPWGSMSTIITHLYIRMGVVLTPQMARLLLMAILSDTLNLLSVTTTNADRFAVSVLSQYIGLTGVTDVADLAKRMFQAKTKFIVNLGAYEMVRGDQKDFEFGRWKFGISVLEVTAPHAVLQHAQDIIMELRFLKKEKGKTDHFPGQDGVETDKKHKELDFAFLFVVDVLNQSSYLIVCGGREKFLAEQAFPDIPFQAAFEDIKAPGNTISGDETMMMLPDMVSRKKQFAPTFFATLGSPKWQEIAKSNPTFHETARREAKLDARMKAEQLKRPTMVQDNMGLKRSFSYLRMAMDTDKTGDLSSNNGDASEEEITSL